MNNTLIKENFGPLLIIGGHPKDVAPLHLTLENIGATGGSLLNIGAPETFVYFLTNEKDFLHGLAMAKTIADTSDKWKGVKGGAIGHYREVAKKILDEIPVENFYPKGEQDYLLGIWNFQGNKFVEQEHPFDRAEKEDDVKNAECFA